MIVYYALASAYYTLDEGATPAFKDENEYVSTSATPSGSSLQLDANCYLST